jgi:hypothetical protein
MPGYGVRTPPSEYRRGPDLALLGPRPAPRRPGTELRRQISDSLRTSTVQFVRCRGPPCRKVSRWSQGVERGERQNPATEREGCG